MKLPRISARILITSLLATHVYADAVTLTQFQQISGFTPACTTAYNTPVEGCTADDFTNGNPCSQACVRGIRKITTLLNTACAGISASPNTLIGMFFQGKGVAALCPKIAPATIAGPPTIPTSSSAPSSTASDAATNTSAAPESTTSTSSQSPSSSPSSTPSSTVTATTSTTTTTESTDSSSSAISSAISSTPSIQTSINIIMTGSAASTATPSNTNFGGDVGISGGKNAASTSNPHVLSILLVMASLMMGFLI